MTRGTGRPEDGKRRLVVQDGTHDGAHDGIQNSDRGAALLLVVMLTVVVGMLGLLITASVLQQVRPALFAEKNTRTVFAAESGIQAALGQLRTVSTTGPGGAVVGDLSKLPCGLLGAVDNAGDGLSYDVQISYFTTDPSGRSPNTTDPRGSASGQIPCDPVAGVASTPSFAYIEAKGLAVGPTSFADSAGNRQLVATYRFNINTSNVPGGLIWTPRQALCLQASAAVVGSNITYVPASSCVSGKTLQTWVYDTDYKIKLGSTVGTATPLCMSRALLSGADVTLALCATSPSATHARQLFSYTDGSKFFADYDAVTVSNSTCLWAGRKNVSSGSTLRVAITGCSSQNDEWGSFAPEAEVGAGGAGAATRQIVNYSEFGRCADMTYPVGKYPYQILYPCKQDAEGTAVISSAEDKSWNQRWAYTTPSAGATTAATTISVTNIYDGFRKLCLTTPVAGASPGYVTFSACTGAKNQEYVRSEYTGRYATSYTFVTSTGLCLDLGPEQSPGGIAWSTIVTAPCTGGLGQKWNALPEPGSAGLSNTREIAGG